MNAKTCAVPRPFLLLWPVLFLFAGCPSGPGQGGPNTVEEIHRITTELGGKVDTIATNQNALIERQKDLEARTGERMQLAADQVDGAFYVNERNAVNPYQRLTGEKLKTAASLLGQPTPESQKRVIEELRLALGASQQDQALLAAMLEEERGKAAEAVAARDAALKAVGAATVQVQSATTALQTTATKLTSAEERARLEAAVAKDAQEAKAKAQAANTRLHIAYGFMGLGGLLIVAAIVATFLHVPGVLAGGLAGGGALLALGWLLTVLEDLLRKRWFQISLGVVLLAAVGIVGVLIYRAWKTRRKATMDAAIGQGAIGAIQEAKNDDAKLGREVYTSLRPYLKEWFVDDDGKPDTTIEKEIDQRLLALNLKNPQGAEAAVLNALRGVSTVTDPAKDPHVAKDPILASPPGGGS